MSQAIQSAGFQPAVSASTATAPKTKRKAHPALGPKRLLFPCLPFVTEQPGRTPGLCWFDVPAEDYSPGCLTGMQAFGAYMAAQRAGLQFYRGGVLAEVFAALRERGDEPSRKGAAVGFLELMDRWQQLAAGSLDPSRLVAHEIASMQRFVAEEAARKAAAPAEFVARMRAAKLAKRAATAAQGVHHG